MYNRALFTVLVILVSMPIYEYRCEACNHQFDALQKMSDEALKNCPNCAKPALIKLVSAPAFRLNGTGWYETDFKTGKDNKKNLVDSGNSRTESNAPASKEKGASSSAT